MWRLSSYNWQRAKSHVWEAQDVGIPDRDTRAACVLWKRLDQTGVQQQSNICYSFIGHSYIYMHAACSMQPWAGGAVRGRGCLPACLPATIRWRCARAHQNPPHITDRLTLLPDTPYYLFSQYVSISMSFRVVEYVSIDHCFYLENSRKAVNHNMYINWLLFFSKLYCVFQWADEINHKMCFNLIS